jgi:Zinc-ribbon containing domain
MPEPSTASRDATVTATCLRCQRPTPAGRGRLYCSPACRQAAYRRRHTPTASPPPPPSGRPRRDSTVYLCPDCDTRTVGQQRCNDCNTFTRRLGIGGTCPHCEEPVTVDELLQTSLDNT